MHSGIGFGLLLFMGVVLATRSSALSAPTEDPTEQAIRKHRMGTITIQARPGASVKVTQLGHEFWFGTAISRRAFRADFPAEARRRYLEILKENFNAAVHENALKWYSTQRTRDRVSYDDADRMLAWCRQNGIVVRGHCLFWAVDRFVQDWVKQLDNAELRDAVERRAREVTGRYRGRIVEYDVNNEMLHGHFYETKLGPDVRVQMFRWANAGDPNAVLYVNDYNILSGKDLARYESQIETLLAQGAPVGGIGCQGHFQKPVSLEQVKASLDRLARFGLPVKVTEFDVNTTDEAEKARFLEGFYRTCFAHPAVEGILMWGFWEGLHWRPQAALWKRDFTPTPAADVYRELVFNRWWTRWEGTADAGGACEVPAFYGRHRIEVDGVAKEIELRKADRTVELNCPGSDPDAWTAAVGQ